MLKSKHRQIVATVVNGESVRRAARLCGVSRATVYRCIRSAGVLPKQRAVMTIPMYTMSDVERIMR